MQHYKTAGRNQYQIGMKLLNKQRYHSPKETYITLGALTVIFIAACAYFGLVPLNFNNSLFRFSLIALLLIWSIPAWILDPKTGRHLPGSRYFYIPLAIAGIFVAVTLLVRVFVSPVFQASDYRSLITVEDNQNFAESVEDYSTMQIPVVDRSLAEKLGDKKLGEDNLGSQYHVGDYYMINYNHNLYWIAPIEYNGFFPWLNRKSSPGYVLINANNQSDVSIVKTGLKYLESAYFGDDLERSMYFDIPGAWRAGNPHLELDDNGQPQFIESVYTNRFGYTSGTDVLGVIITDPISGISVFYGEGHEDIPEWVDHVQSEDVIIKHLNYWGRYVNGFMNTIFAKKDILKVSTGINYVYSNGRMYLQTGMTSIGSDESIVGMMMVDMRTKEAKFCRIGGATEYAAAQSAIGYEQSMKFTASDPIMINLDGTPTYFLMLKDNEGLVKRYAYVNVRDYRLVKTAETRESALAQYKSLIQAGDSDIKLTATVSEIYAAAVDGNTYYYIKFTNNGSAETDGKIFVASIKLSDELPFIKAGDAVRFSYMVNNGKNEITFFAKEP